MKNPRVLFINPPAMPYREQAAFLDQSSILRIPSFSMPIGLIDLAAYLRSRINNVDIEILDIGKDLYKIYMDYDAIPPMTVEAFIDSELDTVSFEPDIVGVSISFSTSHINSMKIIDKVKRRWSKTTVICGGNHATNCVNILLSNPDIDYVLRGEGEIAFTEFVKQIESSKKSIDVFGIINRAKLKTDLNQMSPMIQDLDDTPMPAYNLLDLETYKKTVGASVMFTRGCVFQCTFCATRTVHGNKVRFKSNDRIMREFAYLVKEHKFNHIVIEDDLFAARKDKFLELADRIMDLNAPLRFKLPQGLSVVTLNEEIIDKMVSMGINEAAVAIESGSPYTQKHIIKKNLSLPKAVKILEYFRKKNFFVYVNFILGFAGETRQLMQETVDFIKKLDVDWVYIFHALPLPGTEMFKSFESAGIISLHNFDWDGIRLGRRTFDTPDISAKDLEDLVYDTNIECNFFNNSNIMHGRYKRAIDILTRLIINPYPFHVVGYYNRAVSYLGLGDKMNAEVDFNKCIEWIDKNEESKRLYERYGGKMVLLKKYINNAEVGLSSKNG